MLAINKLRSQVERQVRSPEYLKGFLKYMNVHVLPNFGDRAVDEVTPKVWAGFIADLYRDRPTIARATVNQIRNGLNACMRMAIEQEHLTVAPTFPIESESHRDRKGRVWFQPDEQSRLLSALDQYEQEHQTTPHRYDAIESELVREVHVGDWLTCRRVPQREVQRHRCEEVEGTPVSAPYRNSQHRGQAID